MCYASLRYTHCSVRNHAALLKDMVTIMKITTLLIASAFAATAFGAQAQDTTETTTTPTAGVPNLNLPTGLDVQNFLLAGLPFAGLAGAISSLPDGDNTTSTTSTN